MRILQSFIGKLRLVMLLLILLNQLAYAQRDRSYLEETNQNALKEMAQRLAQGYQRNIQKAREAAKERGMPTRLVKEDGTVIELHGIDITTGELFYYTTNNLDAGRTTNTNEVWQSGSLNLSLSGNGYTIGTWDAGGIYTGHPDFSSRVTQKDNPGSNSNHATHVAGTLIGNSSGYGGSPSDQAKGMAYEAKLDAYKFNSDASEMATAAANGLLVSNHSYGKVTGWSHGDYGKGTGWYWFGNPFVSNNQEDHWFGYYKKTTANWDTIAYNAPYYLITKAVGNDRDDDDPNTKHYKLDKNFNWVSSTTSRNDDGNYDCIPPKGAAKNILTVGAIKDKPSSGNPTSNDMTSMSSWGPADDGRIKPDIVTNGKNVTSAWGSSSHHSMTGTSSASPNAAGSMLLLQEHYYNQYGQQMRAATLKGLVIHTAIEAGSHVGPDYKFGWGLMNTENAATVIANDSGGQYIKEQSLANNGTYTFDVYSDGQKPLKATICWTDVPSSPPDTPGGWQVDNRTKMLVNDLDLRVMDPSGTTHKPFELDPNNPAQAPARQDNDVDNVEQVYIGSPSAGTYTVEVTHKGTLTDIKGNNAPQDFSLIITGGGSKWLGSSGNNWNNSSNWSGKIPDKDEAAFIPKGRSNYPEITGNRKVRNLSIEDGTTQGQLTIKNGGTLKVKGEITNKGKNNLGSGKLVMNGASGKQYIRGNGELTINELTIDNPDGVSLQTSMKISSKLNLTNGVVHIPNSDDQLTVADNAKISPAGGQSGSYVQGTVKKVGDDAFTFPLGDGGQWARLKISSPAQTTDAFSASYAQAAYNNTTSFASGSGLHNVSDVEYWTLNRDKGSSNVDVTLYWEDGSASGSNIDKLSNSNPKEPVIAHWNGSEWENLGQNSNTGTASAGSITVTGVSSFSPFTFGSKSGNDNPLPVELLNFDAEPAEDHVSLNWATASETNNRHFRIQKQRSNGWNTIGTVEGNGTTANKHTYTFEDPKVKPGETYYYRLKQVDFDGSHSYSNVRSVALSEGASVTSLFIMPNPVKDALTYRLKGQKSQKLSVQVISAYGITVYQNQQAVPKGKFEQTIQLDGLMAGHYTLIIQGKHQTFREPFVIID